MTTEHPFNSWLEEAKTDEKFAYLFARLEEAQKEIIELKNQNKDLKGNRNYLLTLLKTHTHDPQGRMVIPGELVKFND